MERVFVRAVKGRFPDRAGKIEGRHIEASVQEEGECVRIRLDDEERPDFWIELTIDLGGTSR